MVEIRNVFRHFGQFGVEVDFWNVKVVHSCNAFFVFI